MDRELIRVYHIVGLGTPEDDYIPMMWESSPAPFSERWFDFKYVRGRRIWGLNRPAVFTRENLREVFALYRRVTGTDNFP